MHPKDLAERIENAFGELDPPSLEEMAAEDCSVEDDFLQAVEARTWKELRPLRQYLQSGQEIIVFSAKAYQYYIPAFLYALIGATEDDFYLGHVLKSLWYENGPATRERARSLYRVPPGGWEELMPEIEEQFPAFTYEERRIEAEERVRIAKMLAKVTEMTGHDWGDISHLRKRWEERMALLTPQQKMCIALTLVHILERSPHSSYAGRIQIILDKYWRVFLTEAGDR